MEVYIKVVICLLLVVYFTRQSTIAETQLNMFLNAEITDENRDYIESYVKQLKFETRINKAFLVANVIAVAVKVINLI